MVQKLSLAGYHSWSSLSLCFYFSSIWMNCLLFERWLLTHSWFLPVMPYSSNFLRRIEWSTVSKALDRSKSIFFIFKRFSYLFNLLYCCMVSWMTALETDFFHIKYFRSSIRTNNYSWCAQVFWKTMGAQILVYSYLRHYCPHPYKSEWPVLLLSRKNLRVKQIF